MAILMFVASTGLTIDLHYCKGRLKNMNLFGKAKSCHEKGKGMKNCPHHKKMMADDLEGISNSKKGCCSSKTIHLHSDKDQQLQGNDAFVLSTQLKQFVIALVETFLKSTFSETKAPRYAHYNPPVISRDIYALLESYLI